VAQSEFTAIPIIQDRAGVRLSYATVAGVSTKHGANSTDSGKLYGTIVDDGAGAYHLDLFADFAKSAPSKRLTSAPAALGTYFDLTEVNASGMTGRARIDGAGALASPLLILSFATDLDVFKDQARAATMPSYDPTYGLAAFHADAMRRILLNDLPAAIPELFRTLKISAFVPASAGAELPDLTKLESAESLRSAQGDLVRALAAAEANYVEEFAEIERMARAAYAEDMRSIAAANAPESEDVATQVNSGFGISEFVR
jgi:hypothetical protein